ncbi:MAG TPA: phosphotransferase [Candidatus Acidoferrales bacterium]|nr:phosphotransferase [Candidatus Acidoferrales bacterium]
MTADLMALETEVRDAVARGGLRPRHLVLVSPLGERKGMRYAYRVETDDGHIVKARHFGSAAEAQRVHDLRLGLEGAFAPVLGCFGAVLIEAWIEGAMLSVLEAEAWVSTAGALLGRLHARPLGPDVSTRRETTRWNEAAAADLALLREAAVLPAAGCEAARAALQRQDPGRARVALIHKDFCAENMLIDTNGALRIIDTEQLAVEPIGFDIAWTWHRWPMSPQSWARFMAGYRAAAPAEPEAWEYWRIVTGLTLARVFFQRMPARLDAQLASLRRCIASAAGEEISTR